MLSFLLASMTLAAQPAPPEEEATTPYNYSAEAPAAEAVAEETRPYITVQKDGGIIYARPDTRRKVGAFQFGGEGVEMWFDTDYEDGRQSKTLWRFQCSQRTFKLMSFVDYSVDGEVTSRYKDTKSLPWSGGQDVIPDSVGETMFRVACESG